MNEKETYEQLTELQKRMKEDYGLDLLMDDCMTGIKGSSSPSATDRKEQHSATNPVCEKQTSPLAPSNEPGYLLSPNNQDKKKVYFRECPIKGWNFYVDHELWDELYEGVKLALVRDRKNKHDKYAVAIALDDDFDGNPEEFDMNFIIGYVPRSENKFIAQMMDLGWNDVFAAELTTVKAYGNYDSRLRMTIYIQSKDNKEEDNKKRMYAIKMSDETQGYISDSLTEKGCVYFRWGGFPPWERDLPRKGDQVLLLQQRAENALVYLTHVIARGDEAAPFLDNPEEELNQVDDCLPFILTNITGPVTLPLACIAFLKVEEDSPDGHLTDDVAQRINSLLSEIGRVK